MTIMIIIVKNRIVAVTGGLCIEVSSLLKYLE